MQVNLPFQLIFKSNLSHDPYLSLGLTAEIMPCLTKTKNRPEGRFFAYLHDVTLFVQKKVRGRRNLGAELGMISGIILKNSVIFCLEGMLS